MREWFTGKVKYQKPDHQGKLKSVTETYLIDAVSFTDAETRIHGEFESIIQGEFKVNSLVPAKITDIFDYEDSEKWVKCKVSYVTVDEESGKESKINNLMLVTADNLKQAYERIEESLKDMLVPFEINSMADTNIIDVFPFGGEKEAYAKVVEVIKKEDVEITTTLKD